MGSQTITISETVDRILHSGRWLSVVLTGGGVGLVPWLLQRPGGSKAIAEVIIPYHEGAITAFLGHRPEQFCSSATARALAVVAFGRARQMTGTTEPCAGVACTASLVTDRPKRGDHRIHVACQTEAVTGEYSVVLVKGLRDRPAEDELAARLTLRAITEACLTDAFVPIDLRAEESVHTRRVEAPREWQEVFLQVRAYAAARPSPAVDLTRPCGILAGSFNPFHSGHRGMLEVAGHLLGVPVVLELTLVNADKPPLDYCSLSDRLATIPEDLPVILTRAATFVEKARLFPGATFIVGVDTLMRIVDPRFYGGEETAMLNALEELAAHDCRFIAFGRQIGDRFVTADQITLPPILRERCQSVPEHLFRQDISSTAIRQSRGQEKSL